MAVTLEAVIGTLAFVRGKLAIYGEFGADVPDQLKTEEMNLVSQIKALMHDELARKLKLAQARVETLKTPDQKRADAMAEVERLTKQLGG